MGDIYDLRTEDGPAKVEVRGAGLYMDDERVDLRSVSWDSERRYPFFFMVMIVAIEAILGISAFAGVLAVGGLEWLAFVVVLPIAALIVLFTVHFLGRKVDLVVIEHGKGETALSGDPAKLRELHYRTSKMTLSRVAREGRDLPEGRAGSAEGSKVLGEKESDALRKDLRRIPGKARTLKGKICPQCGSTEMYYEAGLMTGYVYHCKRCDYVGSFVIEKELSV